MLVRAVLQLAVDYVGALANIGLQVAPPLKDLLFGLSVDLFPLCGLPTATV